jgi:hypothetical protein
VLCGLTKLAERNPPSRDNSANASASLHVMPNYCRALAKDNDRGGAAHHASPIRLRAVTGIVVSHSRVQSSTVTVIT